MADIQIRKKGSKNFLHVSSDLELISSDLRFASVNDRGFFTRNNGAPFFLKEGYLITEISVFDDTVSGSEEVFASFELLTNRLVELGYPAFYEDGEVIFPKVLKSDFLEISPQIGFTLTNNNWWGTANNFYTKYGLRVGNLGAGVVDTNAFADHIENFAYSTLVPYKCKVVSVLFNWFNNGAGGNVEFKLRNYENDFTGTDINGNNSVGINNQVVASSGLIATASGYYHKNIIDNTSGVDDTLVLPKNSNLRLYLRRSAGSGNLPFQKFNCWVVIQEVE